MNFSGISPDSVFLLAENRFNDSKSFYEEHKEQLQRGILLPMRQLTEDVSDIMLNMNGDMILQPGRCISRIRRDTRFTNDKSLYRENMWIMFRHQKNHLPTPMLWFEFFPSGYDIGCGIISTTPAFMDFWRRSIVGRKNAFLSAVKRAQSAGLTADGQHYKRSKADIDGIGGRLAEFYDMKEFFMSMHTDGIDDLSRPEFLVEKLRRVYLAAAPLYKFLLTLTTEFNCSTEEL